LSFAFAPNGFLNMTTNNETLNWYKNNAASYAAAIENIVSWDQVTEFTSLLPWQGLILDAGCNGGRDCRVFAKMGYKSIGLDLVRTSLKIAKVKNHSEFINADFFNTPFPDNCFDGLWVHASIHHLETFNDVASVFKEFFRILKPLGIIHLATQAQTSEQKTTIVFDTLAKAERFYRYFTGQELRGLFVNSGFEPIQINQHKEISDKVNGGRGDVEWLVALARKSIAVVE